MIDPRTRTGLLLALLLFASLGVAAAKAGKTEKPSPEAEYRSGWLASIPTPPPSPSRPSQGSYEVFDEHGKKVGEARPKSWQPTPEDYRKARDLAVSHMSRAAEADPKNVTYQASLSYWAYASIQYDKAKDAADAALARERRDPLLYVLRGQAEAALVMLDPVKAGGNIGKAMTAFDRAAELDPQNALPVLQAVSVALDVDRLDLVQPRLKQALSRPACRLYRLSIPADLQTGKAESLRTWEQLQMGLWSGLLARCQNVSTRLLRFGRQEEKEGKLDAAEANYRQALAVSRLVGRAEPHLLITLGVAMDMLDPTYAALSRFAAARQQEAEAKGDAVAAARWKGEVEHWQGEAGILVIGRAELEADVTRYFEAVAKTPPATPEEMLKIESQTIERAYLGVGLGEKEPAKAPAPAPR